MTLKIENLYPWGLPLPPRPVLEPADEWAEEDMLDAFQYLVAEVGWPYYSGGTPRKFVESVLGVYFDH